MRARAIGLLVIGLIAVAFGVVWTTVVVPTSKKIPQDYQQSVDFQGTYSVLKEQAFLQELLASAAVRQVMANPGALPLLAEPATLQLLSSDTVKGLLANPADLQQVSDPKLQQMLADPAVQALLADPQIMATLASPATAAALTNPTVQELLATPGAVALLGDPRLQQILANPDAARQSNDPATKAVLANPLMQKLLADPAMLSLLAKPGVQVLLANPQFLPTLANPAIQQLLANPALFQLMTNPLVPTLLANPVIQQLLADPASLKLLTDPRTMRLLASPTTLERTTVPVNFQRVRNAERTDGDTIFLRQDFLASVLGTGQPLPQFSSKATLAVDRNTRQYVPGGSEPRRDGFAFPFEVKKDQEYAIWVHEVFDAPQARFVEAGEVEGLKVYNFDIREHGLALPAEPKRNLGIAETLDLAADVAIATKTEPKTGLTVDVASNVKYKLKNAALGNPVVFESNIRYSDASVSSSVQDAREARRSLFWLGTVLPWSVLSAGILLVVGGVAVLGLRRQGT